MNNIKYLFKSVCVSSLLLGMATSCEDFLNVVPEDKQVLETYYTSEDAINANTASLYAAYVWQDYDMNFMWMAGDELAGDLFYTYSEEGQFYLMTFQNGNTYLKQGWNGLFRVVSYCNNIINGMPDAARANGISETVINRALAEARCVRAMAYYLLTEYWENVPIITNNNISGDKVIRHRQSSVYEFIRQDLEFAKDNLPDKPFQNGRCSRYTATGMLAKLHLTMASHLEDANSANNFASAKAYAEDVIKNSGLELYKDLTTLFYPVANTCSESLFSILCTNSGYGYGNGRNIAHSRSAILTQGSSWGAGKGPTLSLQEAFETGDQRRDLTFMRQGDSYSNLAGGGYVYENYSADETTEQPNEMLAHIRKYLIGASADCDNLAGASNQDAGNCLYLLRLSDIYLCYVEACIGAGSSTSDALAVDVFKQVRNRAHLDWSKSTVSYNDLIHERRVEFAFESINFFDIKRMSYRSMATALQYLNEMKRERQYINNGIYAITDKNTGSMYHGGFTSVDPKEDGKGTPFYLNQEIAEIHITESNLILPIPAETITKTPSILQDPVDYQF
ncbi:MAG: RagB/SusD family nutrient uptake outer membrane protein [Bacteroidales bacterium]